MNLSIGIVGLPNVGPSTTLAIPEVYVLASWCRVYGTRLQSYQYAQSLS